MDSKCVSLFEVNHSITIQCKIIWLSHWQAPATQATVMSNWFFVVVVLFYFFTIWPWIFLKMYQYCERRLASFDEQMLDCHISIQRRANKVLSMRTIPVTYASISLHHSRIVKNCWHRKASKHITISCLRWVSSQWRLVTLMTTSIGKWGNLKNKKQAITKNSDLACLLTLWKFTPRVFPF